MVEVVANGIVDGRWLEVRIRSDNVFRLLARPMLSSDEIYTDARTGYRGAPAANTRNLDDMGMVCLMCFRQSKPPATNSLYRVRGIRLTTRAAQLQEVARRVLEIE